MGRSPCCSKEGLNRGAWTKREDMILSEYIRIHGDGGWRNIPKRAGLKRCGKSCRLRWLNYLRPDIKRGNISPDEEELIIRLHRLLGNRWSLIAGRLPGRTDNEIKNYWNTHMSKKLLPMKESQLKILSSKPPSRLPNQVFKANPVKITTVVSPSGIGRPKCYRNHRSDETMNSSKSRYQALVNDSITGTESNPITSAKVDNLVATEAAMSSLADQQSLESNHFGAATMAESLLYLNELSSPDSDLLCYPSNYSTDFVFYSVPTTQTNKFYSVPTTQTNEFYSVPTTQTNEFEGICSDQSNMEGVDNFTVAEKQGMEELFHNEQRLDWIHDIDYLKKSSSQPLSLLLEAEDEWEERVRGKTVLENGEQIP